MNVFAGESGVFGQDVFDGIAGAEEPEDGLHSDASAADDGAAVADIGIKRDTLGHGWNVARLAGKPRDKTRVMGNGASARSSAPNAKAMPTTWTAAAKNETSRDMITPAARRSKMPGN